MDNHVRIAELQQYIKDGIGIDKNNILFEFEDKDGQTKLEVITINPNHKQSFLYHTEEGKDKIEALEKMLDYVKKTRLQKNSYTIQWSLKGEEKLHTSYFRAANVMEALKKFYHGREMATVNVFSVVLNPIA
ncbi:hypothetical protein [Parvicella tangerina]|uniref:Uncharacterized protein n=1 Tax=Parvicella tangerina TaxID=2829795 RepID=A0A916NRE7_9FLAO|nr:hypothetical protein [Parvicella tangerina]CAG5080990.1 hypothetical protein CRYO30217_01506 [Parvicella tangerina]